MMNIRLIEKAVRFAIDLLESEGIMESTSTIRARVEEWYNKTEIVDAEMLAAAAITGSYQAGTSLDDLLRWKEFYFPSTPIEETIAKISGYLDEEDFKFKEDTLAMENFHVNEIEAAERDLLWR